MHAGVGSVFLGGDFFKDNFVIFKVQYVYMHLLAVVYDFSLYK